MNDEKGNKIAYLSVIAGRTNRDALLTALHDMGIHMTNVVYGKGTVKAGYLQSMFGLIPEVNKLMITCISTSSKIETALRMLEVKFDFNKPNTGIAFTVPVDKVSYKNTNLGEHKMKDNMKALMIVVNAGFADDIVVAMREVGVKGATVSNARGYGARHESILGITVNTEKDLILCVMDGATADKAMHVVEEKFGVKTPAHGICFTLPVEKFIGINKEP